MKTLALTAVSRALPALLALACWAASPVMAGGGSGGGVVSASAGNGDIDMPGEILVKLRSSAALAPLLAKYPVTLIDRFGSRPIYRLKVIGSAKVKDVLLAFALEPDVMLAETNRTHRSPEARKNIPWAIGSESIYMAQWAPQAMRLAEAQQRSLGAGVTVAVLDTGVDRNHPLLKDRLTQGFDFVDFDNDPSEVGSPAQAGFGHGTHVAGLVAMVAPLAHIMPLRVLDADGVGNAWVLAEALLYAVDPDGNPATDDGAQVINLSLGSLQRTRLIDTIAQIVGCAAAVPDDPIGDRSDPGYADDEERCTGRVGAVVVAAAGNDGSNGVKEYPAAEGTYGLLSVAASTAGKRLAAFTNFGSWVDLAAPGEGITSALPGGGYATWSGTSMASPLTAGTAALLRAAQPGMPATDLVRRLKRASAMLCGTNLRQLDAAAALSDVTPPAIVCR